MKPSESCTSSSPLGPLVEVTLQSLEGISWNCEEPPLMYRSGPRPVTFVPPSLPTITATVAFAGSAPDMQVGSSFVCGRTGQVVVESHPATLAEVQAMTNSSSGFPLVAYWDFHEEGSLSSPSLSRSLSSASGVEQPHLTIRLPNANQAKLANADLEHMNRSSRIIHDAPSLDETDASSSSVMNARDDDAGSSLGGLLRGGSAVWSASGDGAMPEIIELHVRVQVDSNHQDDIMVEGISHLVFFSHTNAGTTIMDIPVKKPPRTTSDGGESKQITMDADARLRIKVSVHPSGKRSTGKEVDIEGSASFQSGFLVEDQLEPILRQLRHSERQVAAARGRGKGEILRHRRFDVDYENKSFLKKTRADESSGMFCNGFSWGDVVGALACAVVRCDTGGGLRRSHSYVESTIATSESLDI